jgi:hypothetical protein
MLRKVLIIVVLLPATYFWVLTVVLGITQPFFATLVIGGLLGIIGLIRAGWSLGLKTHHGKQVTQLFLGAGILSALSGAIVLLYEIMGTQGNPSIGVIAIMALLSVTVLGVFELYRIRRIASKENAS